MAALSLRRVTLLVLTLLLLLALASRATYRESISPEPPAAEPLPNAAFGSLRYEGMTSVFEGGFLVWKFRDPSCQGLFRIVEMPLSGDGEPLSQVLRQPDEAITYWFGGAFYAAPERATWLFDYVTQRIFAGFPPHNRVYPSRLYLKLFYPKICSLPAGADWRLLSLAVHR